MFLIPAVWKLKDNAYPRLGNYSYPASFQSLVGAWPGLQDINSSLFTALQEEKTAKLIRVRQKGHALQSHKQLG